MTARSLGSFQELADIALSEGVLSRDQCHQVLAAPDDEILALLDATYRVRRRFCGKRVTLDLSRYELADRAGLSYPYVSAIENGRRRGSSKTIAQIAAALELRPGELVTLADELQLEGSSRAGEDDQMLEPPLRALYEEPVRPALSALSSPRIPSDAAGAPEPVVTDAVDRLVRGMQDVLEDADPAEAEAALLRLVGEKRLRSVIREEIEIYLDRGDSIDDDS